MQRRARTGAAAAVLVLGLTACGGDDSSSDADIQDEIAEQLEADGLLDADAAACFAGVIVDEIGADELEDVDFSATSPPAELQEEFASAGRTAIEACNIDPESLGG